MIIATIVSLGILFFGSSCGKHEATNGLLGAASGAAIGSAVSSKKNKDSGALLGAVIGNIVGREAGRSLDLQEEASEERAARLKRHCIASYQTIKSCGYCRKRGHSTHARYCSDCGGTLIYERVCRNCECASEARCRTLFSSL